MARRLGGRSCCVVSGACVGSGRTRLARAGGLRVGIQPISRRQWKEGTCEAGRAEFVGATRQCGSAPVRGASALGPYVNGVARLVERPPCPRTAVPWPGGLLSQLALFGEFSRATGWRRDRADGGKLGLRLQCALHGTGARSLSARHGRTARLESRPGHVVYAQPKSVVAEAIFPFDLLMCPN